MAEEIKNNFSGGMNLDDSNFLLPPTSYNDALNITRNSIAGGNDNIITNLVGNQIISYSYPAGIGQVIGAYGSELRNEVIFFRWNENGYHGIYRYDNTLRVITKVFESITDSGGIDILNFTQNNKIKSVNIYNRDEGDLLFFLDSLGRPSGFDISKFESGAYTPVTRDLIGKAKIPPSFPPSVVYDNDNQVRTNNLTNKLFRFFYRWIYEDFEKSVFSDFSQVPLPVSILSNIYTNVITNNNVIRLVANTGGRTVTSVEIGMSYVNGTNNWSDFQSIEIIKKSSLYLNQVTTQSSIGGTTTSVNSVFSGIEIAGTIINIYLTLLPSTKTLVGTYTTVSGDSTTSIAAALVTSINGLGIASPANSLDNVLFYFFDNSMYSFGEIDILNNTNVDNLDFLYSFYNDSTYPSIVITESIQPYDFIPDKANAQGMPNGNVLLYGGITEGYNKDTIANSIITVGTIAAGNGGAIGDLSSVAGPISFFSGTAFCPVTLSGIPAAGTVLNLMVRRRSDGVEIVAGTYTTISSDTVNTIIAKFTVSGSGISKNGYSGATMTIALNKSTYEALPSSNDWLAMSITPPATTLASNSVPTWKWSTSRNIARGYFDKNLKSNGILYTDKINFPAYSENGSQIPMLPYIDYKINDIPPIWAYSMRFYFTKDATYYFFWQSFKCIIDSDSKSIYFEVSSLIYNATQNPLTSTVCSYSFLQGDRLRLIRRNSDNFVFSDLYDAPITGLVVAPTIGGTIETGKQYIKIPNINPFTSGIGVADSYVFEIYRPAQQAGDANDQVYYTLGRDYPILDPTLPTRRHGGQIADQVVGVSPAEYTFYKGDAYFRGRTISEAPIGYATFNVMDANFVDFYISAVSSVDGRPSIIDTNAKQQFFGATIRFSQAYEANTNLNGFNRFYGEDLMDVDYTFGNITAFSVRDRFMKCFQQFKIGTIPLYAQLTKDGSGNVSLIVSDKLLNPIQYRIGNFGLSEAESLASWHFADYGVDAPKGAIWRDSNDGINSISELYKVNSWATLELPQRTGDLKIYGGIVPKKNQYICALEATCVNVSISSFTLPNGVVGTPYLYNVNLLGTLNFTISNLAIPSWMSASIVGYVLTLSGTPNVVISELAVSLTVSNGCGFVAINQTINVSGAACIPVDIFAIPTLPNAYSTVAYSYGIPLAGSPTFTLSAITAPAWMTITIVGSSIQITGTPESGDTGTDIPVLFTISNECGSFDFAGEINVQAYGVVFGLATNQTGDSLNSSETTNLTNGVAGATVTIEVDGYTNSNGGTLTENGNVIVLSDTFTVTLDGSGNGSYVTAINGVVNPSSGILGHFLITSTTSGIIGTNDTHQVNKAY